jgi:hypothetical protein
MPTKWEPYYCRNGQISARESCQELAKLTAHLLPTKSMQAHLAKKDFPLRHTFFLKCPNFADFFMVLPKFARKQLYLFSMHYSFPQISSDFFPGFQAFNPSF